MPPLGLSRCTRCPALIAPEELQAFLSNDHLCSNCKYETDSEYAERTVNTHKQPTVREDAA